MDQIVERLNVLLYLAVAALVLAAVAAVISAWCLMMLRRLHRAETPWQRKVSAELFDEHSAPATLQPPVTLSPTVPLRPVVREEDARSSVPSYEPPVPEPSRPAWLPPPASSRRR